MVVAVRLALYGDLMLLFGMAAYSLHAGGGARPPHRGLTALLTAGGLVFNGIGFASSTAAMMGGTFADIDGETLRFLLLETGFGLAFLVRTAALAVLLALCLRQAIPRLPAVALGALALGSLAWSGHAAASEGWQGSWHLASDVVHLLAAGAWLGALVALLAILARANREAAALAEAGEALTRFGGPGTAIVALLLVTGAYNLVMIVGLDGLRDLPATTYGQLLLAKLVLFLAMLAMAVSNRWRLTPRLLQATAPRASEAAIRALRTSIRAETGAALAILVLVAWLGTLDPAATS